MAGLPTGTVTFLFTDIQGSTARWEHQPEGMRVALTRHDFLLRAAINDHGGHVVKTMGDGFHAAFARAPDALAAALDAQRRLQAESWGEFGALSVRMALHTGAADERDADYFGPALNRAARLMSAGYGGQILLSEATTALTRDHLPPGVRLIDLGVHRLKDLAGPERVSQAVARGLQADFPPLASVDASPNNLPRQPTALLGRARELAEIHAAISNGARLVTLTGPGGTGKTRLSVQAAAELLGDFPDGAFLVELAPIVDPVLVPSTIAHVLGLRDFGGRPARDVLMEYLRTRNTLLVLDNFEHLVEAADLVADLLSSSSRLRVVVTSREPLRLRGEFEYPVPPLAVPDNGEFRSPQALAQFASVALFVERAAAIRPGFMLTPENAAVVADVCRQLDGLPLAIELAAARIRLLTPHELTAKLERRLPLLTGGGRDLPARQRTLRSAIAWSHDLLDENEQRLFRQLSVCVGGWSLEAATALAQPVDDLQVDVLACLESLVSKSLVKQQVQDGGESRYTMLETIREFGLERLASSGEAFRAGARHAAYYLELAERAEPLLRSPEQVAWIEKLERDHDNLRAALAWASEQGQHDVALRIGVALSWFWHLRSYLVEGYRWLDDVLARTVSDRPTPTRAHALYGAGVLAWLQGSHDTAHARFAESLSVSRAVQDPRRIAYALGGLAMVAEMEGNTATLHECIEQSLSLFAAVDDEWGQAWHLVGAGVDQLAQGNINPACARLEESLALFQHVGDRWATAVPLSYLGQIATRRNEHAEAQTIFERCLEIFRETGDRTRIVEALTDLGGVALRRGDLMLAGERFRESLVRAQQLGDTQRVAYALGGLGVVAGARQQAESAADLLGAADRLLDAVGVVTDPEDRVDYDRITAPLREQLTPSFVSSRRSLSVDEAIAHALDLASST